MFVLKTGNLTPTQNGCLKQVHSKYDFRGKKTKKQKQKQNKTKQNKKQNKTKQKHTYTLGYCLDFITPEDLLYFIINNALKIFIYILKVNYVNYVY